MPHPSLPMWPSVQVRADVDAANVRQYRPLHIAARGGHLALVNALIMAKADLDRPDSAYASQTFNCILKRARSRNPAVSHSPESGFHFL